MIDILLETIRAVVVCVIFIYLWIAGKKQDICKQAGWSYILIGFALILFGMIIDITDNFDSLNKFLIIGDTKYQAFLEKVVGYLFGFILLAIGFWKWLPIVNALKQAERKLNRSREELEAKVKERTADLKNINNELLQSQERLETLLHSMPFGIVIVDSKTKKIVDANPQAALMIGAQVDRIIGSECHKFICPAEKGECPITDLGQTVDNSERELITAGGESLPILKTVIPIDLDGRDCLIECFIDITDRKHAEVERIGREKLQGIIEMSGAVCHELNQPLQSVSTYSELLMMEMDKKKPTYEKIKEIKGQVDRMGGITKKLMHITKYETKGYLMGQIIDIDKASK